MAKLSPNLTDCSVAIVYDRVTTKHGGAEKVLVALHQLFPKAPIFTSVYHKENTTWAKNMQVIPSWLQKIPFAQKNHRWLLPLLPLAFESFDLSSYNLVLSVTSAEAKGVITQPNQLHVCYLLTPTRYLYSHYQTYLADFNLFPGSKKLVKSFFNYIKWWDLAAKARPDALIPISQLIADRIIHYYKRKPAKTIYPPVENKPLAKKTPVSLPKEFKKYLLVVSRFVSYKKIDLVIKAAQKLNKKLVLVGDGPQKKQLQEIIKHGPNPENTVVLSCQTDYEVLSLMHHAQAVIMPGVEDFGITAFESIHQQTPVIIHYESGASELIEHAKTGIHLKDLTVNGLIEAIELLETTSFSKQEMAKVINKIETKQFKKNIQQVLTTLWKEHYGKHT